MAPGVPGATDRGRTDRLCPGQMETMPRVQSPVPALGKRPQLQGDHAMSQVVGGACHKGTMQCHACPSRTVHYCVSGTAMPQGSAFHLRFHPCNKPCSNYAVSGHISARPGTLRGGGAEAAVGTEADIGQAAGSRGSAAAVVGGCLQEAAKPSVSCPACCPTLRGLTASARARGTHGVGTLSHGMGTA